MRRMREISGDLSMTTPFDTPDWRGMSQGDRDLGLNNGVHVPASAELVAGWYRRSAERRAQYPHHLALPDGTGVPPKCARNILIISISAMARASATGSTSSRPPTRRRRCCSSMVVTG